MTAQSKYHDLLGRTGANTRTVARETNIPYSTLNEWRKGKTKKISMENLTKLANYFGVSVSYFYDDEDLSDEQMTTLRKIHEVSAGTGRISWPSEFEEQEGQLARIVGDSMYPSLKDGDIVKFVEAVDVDPSDFALVRINGDELTCKHIEWTSDGLWIRAENQTVFQDRFYTVREISTIPVQIVGKAVEVRRKL